MWSVRNRIHDIPYSDRARTQSHISCRMRRMWRAFDEMSRNLVNGGLCSKATGGGYTLRFAYSDGSVCVLYCALGRTINTKRYVGKRAERTNKYSMDLQTLPSQYSKGCVRRDRWVTVGTVTVTLPFLLISKQLRRSASSHH